MRASSPQCATLLDPRNILPMTGNKDACTSVPGLSLISNTNYSICVRQQSNLVDDTLKATQGRWPDCALITDMLKGFNGCRLSLRLSNLRLSVKHTPTNTIWRPPSQRDRHAYEMRVWQQQAIFTILCLC
jgi:hypothetical protein